MGKVSAYILFHLFALADGTGESNSGCWGRSLGDMNVNPLSPQKKTKEKSLCIKKHLGVSRAFPFARQSAIPNKA
jgi:hypothetical protein